MNNFNRDNSAWCITDGSAGMISQVKGLAQAMNLEFTFKEVKVKFPWKERKTLTSIGRDEKSF